MSESMTRRPEAELLGLVAARLHRDHAARADGTSCAACGQPWPCSARRLAQLGLDRAATADVRVGVPDPAPGRAN